MFINHSDHIEFLLLFLFLHLFWVSWVPMDPSASHCLGLDAENRQRWNHTRTEQNRESAALEPEPNLLEGPEPFWRRLMAKWPESLIA